jgi:hypothetical protein
MAVKKKKEAIPDGSTIEGIEALLEEFRRIKDEKEDLALKTKKLNEQEAYTEDLIIAKLRSEGLQSVKSPFGSASVGEQIFPAVKNFDQALDWMIKHKRFEFLSNSIKSAAWREAITDGEVIPGVDSFKKDILSFRRTTSKPK